MAETKDIVDFIEKNSDKIVGNIKFKDIENLRFLKYQFRTSDVKKNSPLLQRFYCEYYGLNKIGLTHDFKQEYYKQGAYLMKIEHNQLKDIKRLDFETLALLNKSAYVRSNLKISNKLLMKYKTRLET